ncbi:MAG: hypothetical protein J2P17_27300 [Mycobacterium sp.]|nr:hypothetical protein [Mycobacterium sp.]
MSGTATLAEAFVHQVAGPMATSVAAPIGIIPSLHRISDTVRMTSTPACADVQRLETSTTIQRLPSNQISLVDSTSLSTHAYDGGLDLPAPATTTPRDGVISLVPANISGHVLDTSASRGQQNHTHTDGRGMGKQVCSTDTAPLPANGQS